MRTCVRFMRFSEYEAIISLCVIKYLVFNGHIVFLCDVSTEIIYIYIYDIILYDIYLFTAIGLTPCGSSAVHIYTNNT